MNASLSIFILPMNAFETYCVGALWILGQQIYFDSMTSFPLLNERIGAWSRTWALANTTREDKNPSNPLTVLQDCIDLDADGVDSHTTFTPTHS